MGGEPPFLARPMDPADDLEAGYDHGRRSLSTTSRKPAPPPFQEDLLPTFAGMLDASGLCALSASCSGFRRILDQGEALPALRATVDRRGWTPDWLLWQAAHSATEGGVGELLMTSFLRVEGVKLRRSRRQLELHREAERVRSSQLRVKIWMTALASFSVVPAHCYAKRWPNNPLLAAESSIQCFGAALFVTFLFMLVPSMHSIALGDMHSVCYGSVAHARRFSVEHAPLLNVWWLPFYWCAMRHFVSCPSESLLYDLQFLGFLVFAAHSRCLLLRLAFGAAAGVAQEGIAWAACTCKAGLRQVGASS